MEIPWVAPSVDGGCSYLSHGSAVGCLELTTTLDHIVTSILHHRPIDSYVIGLDLLPISSYTHVARNSYSTNVGAAHCWGAEHINIIACDAPTHHAQSILDLCYIPGNYSVVTMTTTKAATLYSVTAFKLLQGLITQYNIYLNLISHSNRQSAIDHYI